MILNDQNYSAKHWSLCCIKVRINIKNIARVYLSIFPDYFFSAKCYWIEFFSSISILYILGDVRSHFDWCQAFVPFEMIDMGCWHLMKEIWEFEIAESYGQSMRIFGCPGRRIKTQNQIGNSSKFVPCVALSSDIFNIFYDNKNLIPLIH